MDATNAIRCLREDAFLEDVRTALATSSIDARDADIDATIVWIDERRAALAELLELIGGHDDAAMILGTSLIEFKAHWITLNTRVNYAAMTGADVDPILVLKGAALSALIGHLETHLPDRSVEVIHAFLAQPLSERAPRVLDDVGNHARYDPSSHPPAERPEGRDPAATRTSTRYRAA